LTVWVIAVEVLALKLSSALYTAVIECVPTERELRVKVAWPLPSTNWKPKLVTPSKREIVPVGVPVPGAAALTVVVKVMDWP